MHRLALLLACAWCVLLGIGSPCSAQNTRRIPDALIWVQPSGDRAFVSVTFGRYVPRAEVTKAFDRLQQSAGWTPGAVEVENVDGASGKEAKPGQRDGVMTEARALLSSAPQIRESAFVLQPYVDAFAHLDNFDVLYAVDASPAFRGLKAFRSPAVDVALVQAGRPFRYSVSFRNHALPVPRLPLTEPVVGAAPVRSEPGRSAGLLRQFALVVLCAAVVALVAFVLVGRATNKDTRPLTRRG